jgi:hypothetical protein
MAMILSSAAKAQYVTEPDNEAIRMTTVAGATLVTEVSFTLPENYHLQQGCSGDGKDPAELFIEPVDGISLGKVMYKGISMEDRDKKTDRTISDEFKVTMPVITAEQLKSGTYVLKGHLNYRVCTEQNCHLPETCEFSIHLSVM